MSSPYRKLLSSKRSTGRTEEQSTRARTHTHSVLSTILAANTRCFKVALGARCGADRRDARKNPQAGLFPPLLLRMNSAAPSLLQLELLPHPQYYNSYAVSIKNQQPVAMSVIEELRQNNPALTTINIALRSVPSDADLAQALEQNPFVTVIWVDLEGEQRADWNSLLRVIATRANLETVRFEHVTLGLSSRKKYTSTRQLGSRILASDSTEHHHSKCRVLRHSSSQRYFYICGNRIFNHISLFLEPVSLCPHGTGTRSQMSGGGTATQHQH